MKKALLIFGLCAFLAAGAFAQSKSANPKGSSPKSSTGTMLLAPGNLDASVGLGSGFFVGGIDVAGGAEYMLGSFMVADNVPISYGAAVRASYFGWSTSYFGYNESFYYAGGGVFGTAHLALKNVIPTSDFFSKWDVYVGLGLRVADYSYSYNVSYYNGASNLVFGLGTVAGWNWFITPKIAINFEGGYYGFYGAGYIGVLFKL